MEIQFYSFVLGFCLGFLLIYVVDYLLSWNSAMKWQMSAESTILALIAVCVDNYISTTSMKYDMMEASGIEKNLAKTTKNMDAQAFRQWQKAFLDSINLAYSTSTYDVKFYNWKEVMNHVEIIRGEHVK